MNNTFKETFQKLKMSADLEDNILVSYSGGKDSLAVLDLCKKTFKNVKCFFMYFVPGLDCIEKQLEYARARWSVEILQYPHWGLSKVLRAGVYCHPKLQFDKIKETKLKDIYVKVMADTGIKLIATGAKAADGFWRRRYTKATIGSGQYDFLLQPVYDWNKYDVLAYLKTNDIPIPDNDGRNATGVDLSSASLLWLHDKHPQDFKKLLKYFPLAEAVIKKREYFGNEKKTDKD
jgi:3'-phosphoadenosine 5'-phosphosulfate sulfotransferase (PAPS reductase)/FAD synthetase